MFDLPPDLPRLRTLELWHQLWLQRIQAAIAEAEAQEQRQQKEAAHNRPVVAYRIQQQHMTDRRDGYLHLGDCTMGNGRPCTRQQALEALGAGVTACEFCRPDTELGILE